jgi:hypothetical protein
MVFSTQEASMNSIKLMLLGIMIMLSGGFLLIASSGNAASFMMLMIGIGFIVGLGGFLQKDKA